MCVCVCVLCITPEFIADLISYKLIHMYILTLSKIVVDNIHLFYHIFQRKIKLSISCASSAIGSDLLPLQMFQG